MRLEIYFLLVVALKSVLRTDDISYPYPTPDSRQRRRTQLPCIVTRRIELLMNTYETGPSMMLSPILILDRRNRLPPVRTKPVAGYSFYFLFFLLLSTRIWSCNCQSLSTGEKVDVYIQEQIDSYDVVGTHMFASKLFEDDGSWGVNEQ